MKEKISKKVLACSEEVASPGEGKERQRVKRGWSVENLGNLRRHHVAFHLTTPQMEMLRAVAAKHGERTNAMAKMLTISMLVRYLATPATAQADINDRSEHAAQKGE